MSEMFLKIKFMPPSWYKGVGRGVVHGTLEFLICYSILKRFCLQWNAFDLLNKMRYTLWVVALLEACTDTNNGHHLGRFLGFHHELEIKLKPQEMETFVLDM